MLRRYGPQGDHLSIASGAFSLRQISWWYKQERDSGEPGYARDSREFESEDVPGCEVRIRS